MLQNELFRALKTVPKFQLTGPPLHVLTLSQIATIAAFLESGGAGGKAITNHRCKIHSSNVMLPTCN